MTADDKPDLETRRKRDAVFDECLVRLGKAYADLLGIWAVLHARGQRQPYHMDDAADAVETARKQVRKAFGEITALRSLGD